MVPDGLVIYCRFVTGCGTEQESIGYWHFTGLHFYKYHWHLSGAKSASLENQLGSMDR